MATLEALPEASVPLTSTSGCFGARGGEGGVEDEGPVHRLPGRQSCVWIDADGGPGHSSAVGSALWELQPGPVGAQAGAGRLLKGQLESEPKNDPAEQETRGDGARLAEGEVVLLFNGFLSRLRFPLLPFAARVMVFKLPLRASASHFRFLEGC